METAALTAPRAARLCPRDRHPLKEQLLHGVQVDACHECGGVWLDKGEMEQISPGFVAGSQKALQLGFPRAYAAQRCPGCRGGLLPRFFARGRERVEVDICVRCGGTWLDVIDMQQLNVLGPKRLGTGSGPEDRARRAAAAGTLTASAAAGGAAVKAERGVGFPRRASEWFVALTGMPLELGNPCSIFPYVTWTLIALNTSFFLLQALLAGPSGSEVFKDYGLIPARLQEGEIYRLLTAMFLHANIFHLAGNLFFLYTFGDNIEERHGAVPYLLLYLACGFLGGLVSCVLAPEDSVGVPRIGASGAISGILGAYLVAFPRTRLLIGGLFFRFVPLVFRWPVWVFIAFWVLLNAAGWVAQTNMGLYAVDNLAHLGGFAAGLAGGFLLVLRDRAPLD
jgi:membrane associated rhomboid family serine protease/Zn-finger nucleic acid-binding protein